MSSSTASDRQMMVDCEEQVTELLGFLYACPVGLVELAADGTIGLVNPLAMRLLLPIAQGGIVTNFYCIVGAYSPELRHIVGNYRAVSGTVLEGHRIFVHAGGINGSVEPLVLSCTLVKLNEQQLIATLSDVSKQVAQERRLKQAETWFATLLDSVNGFAVISLDREGIINGANEAAELLTGFGCAAMIGQCLDTIDPPENLPASYNAQQQITIAQRDGWHLDQGWRRRRDGERSWCQRLVAAQCNTESSEPRSISGYTVVLRNVSRSGADTAKLKEMLTTDHLTGACNRAHFFEVAERQSLRCRLAGEPLALVALDIDHFKHVNDAYGHPVGDAALKAVTTACKALLRADDTFARLGGEEFVVLLPATGLQDAIDLAERLRLAIGAIELPAGETTLTITASFGCTVSSHSFSTMTELLSAADRLLYTAKRSGRNRVEPAPDHHQPEPSEIRRIDAQTPVCLESTLL